MNMNQVRYALSLAESLSFSNAAKNCSVTRATISNGISHLENELGGSLFIRDYRSVSLTDFGDRMLPFLKIIFAAHNELIENADKFVCQSQ